MKPKGRMRGSRSKLQSVRAMVVMLMAGPLPWWGKLLDPVQHGFESGFHHVETAAVFLQGPAVRVEHVGVSPAENGEQRPGFFPPRSDSARRAVRRATWSW